MSHAPVAFLFMDECAYEPLDLSALTGVLVPADRSCAVRPTGHRQPAPASTAARSARTRNKRKPGSRDCPRAFQPGRRRLVTVVPRSQRIGGRREPSADGTGPGGLRTRRAHVSPAARPAIDLPAGKGGGVRARCWRLGPAALRPWSERREDKAPPACCLGHGNCRSARSSPRWHRSFRARASRGARRCGGRRGSEASPRASERNRG
jgi:hypothetical protein